MSVLTTIAVSIVILLHVLFMVLEMFLWNTPSGRKTFDLSEDFAKQSTTLAANQGLYNGFMAAGLLWGLISTGGYDALIFFLSCIIIAGLYGAATANRSILFIQALPAAIALALLILNNLKITGQTMNQQIKTTIKSTTSLCLLSVLIACSPSGDNTSGKAASQSGSAASETTNEFPFAFEKVANNTWVMHGPRELPNPENKGFMNNPGIVKTSAGLVMIDPGSTVHIGNNVLAEVKKISDQPIVAVFNTHIHGDHWLANQAIKAAYPDVKIYGHTEMLVEIENGEGDNWVSLMDSMTEGASKGTIVVAPDNAVDNTDVIKVGDTQFKMHHYGIAHTKTDIMIEVEENSVIFLGDNVLSLRIPRTSDGTFQGNIDTINTILESDFKTYVPGHGPTGDRAMVENYLGYLTAIYVAAEKAFEDDLDSSDVLNITKETTTAYKDWQGYDDLLGPQGAQAYSEVEAAEF